MVKKFDPTIKASLAVERALEKFIMKRLHPNLNPESVAGKELIAKEKLILAILKRKELSTK